jgi:hypothetical protein
VRAASLEVHRQTGGSVSEVPIRIELDRSGGVAGISVHAAVDTTALPPEQGREIAELVGRVDFATLTEAARAAGSAPPRGADRFQYDLTVQRGDQRYRVSLPESAVPAELKPLLSRVLDYARGS